MKKKILKTIDELLRQEVDLQKTPVLFKWIYDEYPDIEIQMLIKKAEQVTIH